MSHTEITLDGETISLLLLAPNWRRGPALTLRCRDRLTASDSGRENRAPAASLVALEVRETYTARGAAAASLQTWLTTWGSGRIAIPLWWDRLTVATYADRLLDAPYWWDFTGGAVRTTAAALALDPATVIAPLFIGLRAKRPSTSTLSTDRGTLTLELWQDGPAAWSVQPRGWGGELDAWPASLSPTRARLVHLSDDSLRTATAGQGPARARRDGGAPMRWGQDATFVLGSRAAIRDALSFFAAVWGRVGAFTVPSWYTPHAEASPETPDALTARLSDDALELEFLPRGDVAKTQLRFWQLPWELNLPEGEQPVRPARAYLFEFAYRVRRGGPLYSRFTDWGVALTHAGESYAPALIEPGEIKESTQWGESATTVHTHWIAGNPLEREYLGRANGPLHLTLWRCDPDDVAATAEVVAQGIVSEPTRTEHGFDCTVADATTHDVPRWMISKFDYRAAYSPESFLAEDDHERVGTVRAIWADGKVHIEWTDAGGNPAGDYFRGGLIDAGSGDTYELRECIGSWDEGVDGGDAALLPDDPFDHLAVDDTVYCYPAFDGSWAMVKTRYPSLKNDFRGFPYTPGRQPNVATTTGVGGKGGK